MPPLEAKIHRIPIRSKWRARNDRRLDREKLPNGQTDSPGISYCAMGAAWNERTKTRREVEKVAAALIAEIAAIKRMFDHSHLFSGLDDLIEAMVDNRKPELFTTWTSGDFFKTFSSNPTSLGLLPTEAAKEVAYFYSLTFSVFERLKMLAILAEQKPDLSQTGVLSPLMFHKALRASLTEMFGQADRAITALAKLTPPNKRRFWSALPR